MTYYSVTSRTKDDLLAIAESWLPSNPWTYALCLTLAQRDTQDIWQASIDESGKPRLILVHSPPHPIIAIGPGQPTCDLASVIADTLDEHPTQRRQLNAPTAWAEAVIAARSHVSVETRAHIRLHRLEGWPQAPKDVSGEARSLRREEVGQICEWIDCFHLETRPPDYPQTKTQHEDVLSNLDNYLVWTTDDIPVAVARAQRPFQGGWTIGLVFTVPYERNRGYAGAVVHALCQRLLANNATYICLYTDLTNPASNRCYERIGFLPVGDQTVVTWEEQ